MLLRQSMVIAALALSAMPAAARDVDVPTACVLQDQRIQSVTPYETPVRVGRIAYQHVGGATVTVHAEPGLTPQWLRVVLGHRMRQCGLSPKEVRVQVAPGPTGYAVNFIGKDVRMGPSILAQARALK